MQFFSPHKPNTNCKTIQQKLPSEIFIASLYLKHPFCPKNDIFFVSKLVFMLQISIFWLKIWPPKQKRRFGHLNVCAKQIDIDDNNEAIYQTLPFCCQLKLNKHQ